MKTKRPFCRWLIVALLALQGIGALAESAAPGIRIFHEKERMEMLKAYWTRMSAEQPIQAASLKEWEDRAAFLRKRAMAGFGLEPLPPSVPLNLTRGDKIERDDCTITRVAFQTFPGIYAAGYLYMPKKADFPAPAVFHPHGHWANGAANAEVVESRCIGLARRGYVSLVVQMEHTQDLASGLPFRGVALWNNMRGLDVLQSLPQVDKTRLGVTGASGGGMQSTDLAALDPRIACAVIVAYPTYFHRTGYIHAWCCMCNYGPINAMRYMDQQALIAMIAPRPAAVFTLTGDWTAESIDHELKEVAGVYDRFTAEAGPAPSDVEGPKVENIETPALSNVEGNQPYRLRTSASGRFLAERWDGPHDYTKAMRERMYWWMDWWLKGKHEPKPLPEEPLNMEPAAKLEALSVDVPNAYPWTNPNLASAVRAWLKFQPPVLKKKRDLAAYARTLKASLADLLGECRVSSVKCRVQDSHPVGPDLVSGRSRLDTSRSAPGATPDKRSSPTPGSPPSTLDTRHLTLGRETLSGWDVEKLWYASEPDVRIPAFLIRPAGDATPQKKMAVVVSVNGKNDVFVEPLRSMCEAILREGRAVLAIDQRLRGEWAFEVGPAGRAPTLTWQGNVRWWGRPELGMAVHDISAGIAYLATRDDCSLKSLRVVGSGQTAGYAALLAAALDERIKECAADMNHSDFSQGLTDSPGGETFPDYLQRPPILAGILRHGDIGEVAALVAPRKLELFNVDARTPLQTAESAYRLLGAARQFRAATGGEAAVANGGFEQGARGWTCENGAAPTVTTGRADRGTASLELASKQTVIGEPVAVKPMMTYRLVMSVSKPARSTLAVFLQRGGKRVYLATDSDGRMAFQNVENEFITRPGETNVQLVLSASGDTASGSVVRVDSVRIAEKHPVEPLTPDGRELLSVTSVTNLDVGTTITNGAKGTFQVFYGPGHENKVVAEGKDGRRALYAKPKPGTYVGFMAPKLELFKPGALYRFEVTARGKGTIDLCFVGIHACGSPRLGNTGLTDQWKTYTLEFFVESAPQRDGMPTAQLNDGEIWLDSMSMKAVDAAP